MSIPNPLDPNISEEEDEEEPEPKRGTGEGWEGDYFYWEKGKYRQSLQPDGKVLTEIWNHRGGPNHTGEYERQGTPTAPVKGSPFWDIGNPSGGGGGRGGGAGTAPARQNADTARDREERIAAAAKDKAEYDRARQVRQDAIDAEDRQRAKDEAEYKKAIAQRDYDEAKRIRERQEARQERVDKLNEEQRTEDNAYRARQEKTAQDRTQTEKDIARGYVDGMPTLTREQWEAEQANQPGNYYNRSWRTGGEEPPPRPGGIPPVTQGPTTPIPPGTSTAGTRDISQWRNMDIPTILATFSATELARLPLEALTQLPNEALINIGNQYPGGVPAFLKLFPQERLGTFGEDVQAQVRGTGDPNNVQIPVTPPTPGRELPIGGVGPSVTDPRTQSTVDPTIGPGGPQQGAKGEWDYGPDPGSSYAQDMPPPGMKWGFNAAGDRKAIPISGAAPFQEGVTVGGRGGGMAGAPTPTAGLAPALTTPSDNYKRMTGGSDFQNPIWNPAPPLTPGMPPVQPRGTRQPYERMPGGPSFQMYLHQSDQPSAPGGRVQATGDRTILPVKQPASMGTVDPNMTSDALIGKGWTIDPNTGALMSPAGGNGPSAGPPVGIPTVQPGAGSNRMPGDTRNARQGDKTGWIDTSGVPSLNEPDVNGGQKTPLSPWVRNPIMGKPGPSYTNQGNMPTLSAQARSRMGPSARQEWDVTVNRTGGSAEDAAWRDRLLTSGGAVAPRRSQRGMPSLTRR